MTDVTQEDREAAWLYRPSCYKDDQLTREKWNNGAYDDAHGVPIKAFAAHRIAAEQAQADIIASLRAELAEEQERSRRWSLDAFLAGKTLSVAKEELTEALNTSDQCAVAEHVRSALSVIESDTVYTRLKAAGADHESA